ncbi:thiol:disulfide interchange protein DsbA/DsbL [Rhodoferax sp.]|uniref:thiol:disulfide interchange protein DsbA/DsbL n=1 Tax=Rhodoferax sp. TaxID=50421 RepID=UPI00260235A8|nr:thiol:disulfide interchange protein DsbA/DsbL [Rhodoferax sp.]MDD4944457.1 thiol:disulfide interchange protein DsbA/DsbL [Rhodoferax sp.]MDD5480958.1 thiol:disulfide interchange protein DsbA/DsbL [Rhodoferax sp.]
MQRRNFVSGLGCAAALAASATPAVLWAQTNTPKTGTDFIKLDKPVAVDAPAGKVEVIEFFWYNCPHCHAFEPALAAWLNKLPKDVAFKRVPIAFNDSFVPQQRLFYALEAMGQLDSLHARVFKAIHSEKLQLTKAEAIVDWVVKQGVDKTKFLAQFNSFSASTKATRAKQLASAYQLEGVPAIGVAGRYYTDGSLAKSMDRALFVTDFLIDLARKGH